MPNLRRLAAEYEDRAAQYLLEQGFTLVTRRWTTRGGEIDLVALDGEIIVFVEVRTRLGAGGTPEESIDETKLRRMGRAAEVYLAEMELKDPVIRFDLIAIDHDGIRHHRDFARPTSD